MKYSCRAGLFQSAYDYELETGRLVRRGPSGALDMPFANIAEIKVFKEWSLARRLAASICGAEARCVGPMWRGHRHARRQLQLAFPGMASRETAQVLRGMWDNTGRTFADYGHITELMTFSADTSVLGQVVMDERTAALVRHVGGIVR